jgi:hypothetical protein
MKKTIITVSAILFMVTLVAENAFANMRNLRGNAIIVSISDDYGRQFQMHYPMNIDHQYHGARRATVHRRYLQVENGARYHINIQNTTGERVGVVIAVDGRNIISGKKSYLRRNERMYIVSPFDTTTYSGWRTGKNVVNRFFFTRADNSYAHAWKDDTAMGVIAIALYREKAPRRHRRQQEYGAKPESMKRNGSQAPGTGFGHEEYSPSRRVSFHPQRRPVEKLFIKYEWQETLCSIGVINCRPYREDRNRFWSDQEYAPYPPYQQYRKQSRKSSLKF